VYSPIDIGLRPSRLGRCCEILVAALAIIAVLGSDLPDFTRTVLVLIPLVFLLVSRWRRAGFPVRVRWQPVRGDMRVMDTNQWCDVERIEAVLATPWFIFMRLHIRQRYLPLPVMFWRDAMSVADFRRLSVVVRFGRPPQSALDAEVQKR